MKLVCSIFLSCIVFSLKTQTTFSEHVAPIIYNKCSSCHHTGGIAPLSFTNYAEVKKQVGMIVMAALDSKFMPPWMPDTAYSHFVDERRITESEATTIKKWISEGMPQGDKSAEPELPLFPKGSQLGKPDLTVSMQQSFIHKGNNEDAYRVFVLPTGLKEGHDVAAIEIQPGNPKIAHHIILGLDTTRMADKLDNKDEGYGYAQYSGFGFYPTYDNWSGWVPGNKTRFFPQGISNYVLPDSKILLQMHYGPSPIDAKDSTVVNIYYSKTANNRYIRGGLISPNDITDGPFFIPANKKRSFHATYKVVSDYSLISITPHAHWLGKKWEVFAVHPNGDTTHLIKINDWDFNWQNFFSFKKFIKLEKGTMIYTSAEFDNTERNFRQPNNPVKNVMWGESAKEEMFLCYFAYVPYQKGDELIDIAGHVNLMQIDHNLEAKKLIINYSLSDNTPVTIKLYSGDGKLVKDILNNQQTVSGKHSTEIDTKVLKSGTYWVKFTSAYYTESKKATL
ncbi:MAG: T9SS type A sorting domain-containing protein [Bacteroidota bacterium]